MVTWARENGLALYINGTQIARARGYMPQEGDHDKDTFTRLIVGRNAAGAPYGYTRMVASSLVFFDAEVPAESAKNVFMYFSSNGNCDVLFVLPGFLCCLFLCSLKNNKEPPVV